MRAGLRVRLLFSFVFIKIFYRKIVFLGFRFVRFILLMWEYLRVFKILVIFISRKSDDHFVPKNIQYFLMLIVVFHIIIFISLMHCIFLNLLIIILLNRRL